MAPDKVRTVALADDPLWFKDAIIYEVHVRAFYDSDGDGIGDFKGLTEKLDYLHDLGVTAIWLLPFFPSPLRDDGYDIADYRNVHPDYGNLSDFKTFVKEAHRRGLRVITELVLNHTSDRHPWFQRARKARAGSQWRDFYVWSDTPEKYEGVRIIFQDFESSNWAWDPVAKAYFWHRFYSHQPDLNYDSPAVRQEIPRLLDFWLRMGVDGLRLDAVPYLFQREGTNCENLPETHEVLRELRQHVDSKFKNRMLLAEANQWPEDAAAYFGEGDECHMAFHFPIMPRLFISLRMEDRFPIVDSLEQTPTIPDTCQWAIFLRNHDELTLEMVTDEERDYMYRVYAQDRKARINVGIRRRLAPLLQNNRRKTELMTSLLFSLPGTPVIYYGDEIGMGDNIYLGDRNGVRTPMQWSADRNAGFSRANPQSLYLPPIIDPEYHYEAVNVEAQLNNPSSLLWWTKRFIALRKNHQALGRGSTDFLFPDNRKILAFIRRYEKERILVVANLSRFVQYAELDLSAFRGLNPVELFGKTPFPTITDSPYFLTLGPHSFLWFSLDGRVGDHMATDISEKVSEPAAIHISGKWQTVVEGRSKSSLERVLPVFIRRQRWFRGKARRISAARIIEVLSGRTAKANFLHTLVLVEYGEGDPEIYFLPISFAEGEHAEEMLLNHQHLVLSRLVLKDQDRKGVLYDSTSDRDFARECLDLIAAQKSLKGKTGELFGRTTRAFRTINQNHEKGREPSPIGAEQSNTSIVFGESFVLKLFRRLEEGINPELEIGEYLTGRGFPFAAPLAGGLEYRRKKGEPITVGVLHGFVTNQGDAWAYTLDVLSRYFEEALARRPSHEELYIPPSHTLEHLDEDPPPLCFELIASYLESARMLGERSAELHLALAATADDPEFAAEEFTTLYQRSLYQSMRNLAKSVFRVMKQKTPEMPDDLRPAVKAMLDRQDHVLALFKSVLDTKFTATRVRCHGDLHLGQVLFTGNDFVIMDFEGEPARSLGDRRIKRSPLRDAAGMLRSFHYAAHVALFAQKDSGILSAEESDYANALTDFWCYWVSAAYLRAYLRTAGSASFIPASTHELRVMLDAYVLEKAIYELGYELNNRPDWVKIPIEGMAQILGELP